MKNAKIIKALAIAITFGAGTAVADNDEKVDIATLPAAVQTTLQAQATTLGGTIGEIEKEDEDGEISYEAKIVGKDGAKTEVEVAEDGTLIKAKTEHADEDDEKVAFATLPAAIQATLQAQATALGGTLGEIEKEDEDGEISYEAKIVGNDGTRTEVEVAEDGTLIKVKTKKEKKEKEDDDAEVKK